MHTQGDCPPDEPFCTHTALRQLQLYQINANEANARVPRFDHCLRRKRLRASQRCRSGASRDHVNAVALRCGTASSGSAAAGGGLSRLAAVSRACCSWYSTSSE
mmetsp:Transcript_61257/g.162323  ORF Transcript_61257/g.162323 Transcript_61257/m.162323 type:complete len:104 (+) Transcript_61257:122-433(+)